MFSANITTLCKKKSSQSFCSFASIIKQECWKAPTENRLKINTRPGTCVAVIPGERQVDIWERNAYFNLPNGSFFL